MKNTVVVIGGGGREHAITAALKKSEHVGKIYALPGNAGISKIAECVGISVMDFERIKEFCKSVKADMVFVAPDDPLAGGLVDELMSVGIRAFGPTKASAIIEGSKVFAKDFMKKYGIPTAQYETFDNFERAVKYVETACHPLVVKADGLALGKGVIICNSVEESKKALTDIMHDMVFKSAGNSVVIEEFLKGPEVSLLAFCDGEHYSLMPSSQDYKKAYDGDKGLNTGGMGAVSPSPYFNENIKEEVVKNIVEPTVNGMKAEGRAFHGVLYFGLILTAKGVKVLEYNARFGDPETQVVLPKLQSDLLSIMNACIDGKLNELNIEWENTATVAVVAASGGYPSNVVKGYEVYIKDIDGCYIYHSGTAFKDGKMVTNGGRVLCVCAAGKTLKEARTKAYYGVRGITFEGMRYRSDIADFRENN